MSTIVYTKNKKVIMEVPDDFVMGIQDPSGNTLDKMKICSKNTFLKENKIRLNDLENNKANKSETYTKNEINAKETIVNEKITDLENNKANQSTTYTKSEVNDLNDTQDTNLNNEVDRAIQAESDIVSAQNSVNDAQAIANTAFHDKDVAQDGEIANNTQGIVDNESQMLGVGQKWQDVMANRFIDTTYKNSQTRPIQIAIFYGGATGFSHFFVNGVQQFEKYGTNGEFWAVIPSQATYRLTSTGNLDTWSELR